MNLSEARIVLRPRGRLETMDLAFRYLLHDSRRTYAFLVVAALGPPLAATVAARAALGWPWPAVWALALLLGGVVYGVFSVAAGRLLFDRELRAFDVLRAYAARLPQYLAALFVARTLTLLGWSMLVPGLLGWTRFAYVAEAVLLEQVPVRRALSRSAFLSRAFADEALGTLVASLVMSFALVVGFETLAVSLVRDVLSLPVRPERLLTDGGSYFALAGYFFSLPWTATNRFLGYIDGRTRQDGWDVQVRFMALAEGGEG